MGRQMWFTDDQIARMATGAVASGRIPPWRREYWAGQISSGGPAGAQAIVSLLSAVRQPAPVVAAWARDPRSAQAARPAPPRDPAEELYRSVYPDPAAAAEEPTHEVHDRTGLVHQQDETADQAEQGHGAAYGFHEHRHADGQGGTHTHIHEHAGDSAHSPGGLTAHVHDGSPLPLAAASRGVRAGIAAKLRERPVDASMSDDALYRLLFGVDQ